MKIFKIKNTLLFLWSFTCLSACHSSGDYPDGNSAYLPYAPDGIPFIVADSAWSVNLKGNHRAIVHVPNGEYQAVAVTLPWRRSDLNPGRKRIVVYDAKTNKEIQNVKSYDITNETGTIAFQPNKGSVEYYIYYLPYVLRKNYGSGRYSSSPWEDYLPARKDLNATTEEQDSLVSNIAMIPLNEADKKWLSSLPTLPESLPKADLIRFESRLRFDFHTPMGLIATAAETKHLLEKHPENPLLFTEDRAFPIRMTEHLPVRWIEKGTSDSFEGAALRNEYYVWQIGIWSPREKLRNVKVAFSDLVNGNTVIPAKEITCFNQEGTDWDGQPIRFQVNVEKGKIQALWCGVQIPEKVKTGTYIGEATLTAEGMEKRIVHITLHVGKEILQDKGEKDLWRHARLAWLNSTIGIDNNPVLPYQPIKLEKNKIQATEKTVFLQKNGLPEAISIQGKEILSKPVRFIVKTDKGDILFDAADAMPQKAAEGLATFHSSSQQEGIRFECEGQMEFDGYMHYKIQVSSPTERKVKDIQLITDYTPQASEYFIGIGYKEFRGGFRPTHYQWNWEGPWDSFWTGGVEAGLHTEFLGGSYHGPLMNDYKSIPPSTWTNDGKGTISISGVRGEPAQAIASTGATSVSSNPKTFEFAFMITPVKPVNTKKHFSERYSHRSTGMDQAAADGANIQNIHHATLLNPVINYPFIVQQPLIDYIQGQHQQNRKVKLYYTIRELSNFCTEIFALRSLNYEIFPKGEGHGLPWLCEHLENDYKMAWYTPIAEEQYDASVIVNGFSRWVNYYLEGLRWMLQNYKIDGLYLDDVAYDRPVLKRMRKIMEQYRPGSLIDLHSHEQYSMGPANQYMGFFPYIDRLWFGEGFDYNRKMPDEWLVTFSGIPFGLMSEMMIEGINPYLGMIYGATGRYGYGEESNPAPVWKLWKTFGIEDAEMKGYWRDDCPVKTSHPNVKATAYLKPGKMLISLGNFDEQDQTVKLIFNWKALGMTPEKVVLSAPEIKNFQPAETFGINDKIQIKSKKGWLLILETK